MEHNGYLSENPRSDLFFIFFYLFSAHFLKNFIIKDNQEVIDKILLGTEQGQTKNQLDNLSDTARDLLYFAQYFGDKLKFPDFVNLWVVEDRI